MNDLKNAASHFPNLRMKIPKIFELPAPRIIPPDSASLISVKLAFVQLSSHKVVIIPPQKSEKVKKAGVNKKLMKQWKSKHLKIFSLHPLNPTHDSTNNHDHQYLRSRQSRIALLRTPLEVAEDYHGHRWPRVEFLASNLQEN